MINIQPKERVFGLGKKKLKIIGNSQYYCFLAFNDKGGGILEALEEGETAPGYHNV